MRNGKKSKRPHVVIVGGGFGGLTAAQSLDGAELDITLIDRTNHHLFQPLLYQVAMAGLSPAEIASPIRSILAHQDNVKVLLAEAERIDLTERAVHLRDGETLRYDHLILATGAETSYFGHDEWEQFAPGLKSIDDGVEVRQRVLLAFETAEREPDEAKRQALLSFVVIGGGPTGVELAGALAELSRYVLDTDFRVIRPEKAKVRLLEAGPRILASFSEELSTSAVEQLAEIGVEVRTGAKVTKIDNTGVYLEGEKIACSVVLWGAGVRATALTKTLGVELDRAGRVVVEKDLTIPKHPEAYVIGDTAAFLHDGGKPLPGVSPVAMQQARTVAKSIRRALEEKPRLDFSYFDKGSMATIGRKRAIAEMGKMRLSGFVAWMAWLFIHIWYLIGFRNRIVVLFTWFWSYVTYRRGARLITGYGFHDYKQDIATTEGVVPSRRMHKPVVPEVRAPD
jgi:NADH dehydrogenase